jgi:hypothetical protein
MSSRLFAVTDIPVGYTVPPFPSLYWPVGDDRYSLAYLYYAADIWRFTVFWTLTFFVAFYATAGLWAALVHRSRPHKALLVFGSYALIGGVQGFLSGSVIGVLMAAIYKAGVFSMSTWIPLCCGVFQILFNVVTSYSMVSVLY